MLTAFPLPAMTIVAYRMLKVADPIALLDVQGRRAVSEMIPCEVEPNIRVHVIVCEWNLDPEVVLSCLVLVQLLEILMATM